MKKTKTYQGSVTVFFSLTFILLLAVVLTTLEAARDRAVRSSTKLAMYGAVDSMLAQYYLPLFEDYQIFGLYGETANNEELLEHVHTTLCEQMNYYVNPTMDVEKGDTTYFNLCTPDAFHLEVTGLSKLTENSGAYMYAQMVEASKCYGVQSFADWLLEKCKLTKDMGEVSKAYEKQIETQEALVTLDEVVLDLMKYLDGISIKDKKVVVSKSGQIQAEDYFLKMYCTMPITMVSTGIGNQKVLDAVRVHMLNRDKVYEKPISLAQEIKANLEQIQTYEEEEEALNVSIESIEESMAPTKKSIGEIESEIASINQQLSNLTEKEDDKKTSVVSQLESELSGLQSELDTYVDQISEEQEQLNTYSEQLREVVNKKETLEEKNQQNKDTIHKGLRKTLKTQENCYDVLEKAKKRLEEGILSQQTGAEKIRDYEDYLEDIRGNTSKEWMESLDEELTQMKSYLGEKDSGQSMAMYDFKTMKETVLHDMQVLETIKKETKMPEEFTTSQQVDTYIQSLDSLQSLLCTYSIKNIEFDYKTLNLSKDTKSPMKYINSLFRNGILEFLLPDGVELSKAQLDKNQLSEMTDGEDEELNTFFDDLEGESSGLVSDLMKRFGTESGGLLDNIKEMFDRIMFEVYIREYFSSYGMDETNSRNAIKLPTFLEYEQEYILHQKSRDSDNLYLTVRNLIFVRMIVNLIMLFSNKECNQKARITATALVSFTGMAFLISITKALILTVWAIEEAMVDVAILLRHKKLDLIKRDPLVRYEEVLLFHRALVDRKANAYKNKDEKTAMTYSEYLTLFLFFMPVEHKLQGAMNVMEKNIQYRYEDEFQLNQCIYKISARTTCDKTPRFLVLENLAKLYKKEEKQWRFSQEVTVSYE